MLNKWYSLLLEDMLLLLLHLLLLLLRVNCKNIKN